MANLSIFQGSWEYSIGLSIVTLKSWTKTEKRTALFENVTVTKCSTISLYLTKLFVTYNFALASSVTYSEIRSNFLTVWNLCVLCIATLAKNQICSISQNDKKKNFCWEKPLFLPKKPLPLCFYISSLPYLWSSAHAVHVYDIDEHWTAVYSNSFCLVITLPIKRIAVLRTVYYPVT